MPQTTEFRLGVDGVAAFEFSDGTTKNVDLANVSGGGSGSTNLTLTQTANDVTVVSDTGTDATIPTATSSNAGVMSAAQVTELAGKQSAIPSGTSKLLGAPATNGGNPVQITLGTNLSLSGTTLNATGGSSTTIVNDLTTGGTTSALSAEMGKLLQNTKSAAINASPVVPTGVTSLTRTAVTTSGSEAPTGYYNRPLISDHSVTVDVAGAVAGDALMVLNSSGSSITLTASATVVTIPAGKTGEVAYDGASWINPAQVGSSYTDAQALAASVLAGALGTDTTKAPTHSAVTAAIAGVSGVRIIKVPEVLDAGSGVTTETIVWEGLLSSLTGGTEIDFPIKTSGSGTGAKSVNIRVGGTAGVADGTSAWSYSDTNTVRRLMPSLRLSIDRTSILGTSSSLAGSFGSTTTAHPLITGLTPGADIRIKITTSKGTASDVVNFYGNVRVFG